jgi:hypothetical protein
MAEIVTVANETVTTLDKDMKTLFSTSISKKL